MMRWGVIFALGWGSCAAYYQVPRLWTQKSSLTKELHCEHARANVAIASAQSSQSLPKFVTTDCIHQK